MDYMPVQMNVAEAKARLSALIDAALAGDDVVIARDGRPAVKLVPVEAVGRRLGVLADMGWLHDLPLEAFAPEPDDAADAPLVQESR